MKKASAAESSWRPGKVSEMIMDFAGPIMETVKGGPPDIETLRDMMLLVSLCWNVPVLRATEHPEVTKQLHSLEGLPEPLKSILDGLMRDRRTKFGSVSFLIAVEVRGTCIDDASIYAEARTSPGIFGGWS